MVPAPDWPTYARYFPSGESATTGLSNPSAGMCVPSERRAFGGRSMTVCAEGPGALRDLVREEVLPDKLHHDASAPITRPTARTSTGTTTRSFRFGFPAGINDGGSGSLGIPSISIRASA